MTTVLERVQRIITEHTGTIGKQDLWGLRKLAYPIKHMNEGNYVHLQFQVEQLAVGRELNTLLRVTDDLLRYLLVELDVRPPKARVPRRTPVKPGATVPARPAVPVVPAAAVPVVAAAAVPAAPAQ